MDPQHMNSMQQQHMPRGQGSGRRHGPQREPEVCRSHEGRPGEEERVFKEEDFEAAARVPARVRLQAAAAQHCP